ncbi:M20 family metallopeptidase [Candidatus Poribacteria bacterium]|nr:M20 family metallopeptidase [Candidatus Poribacteria bacterium]MBT5533605.1 M20 family metallopeptidase [Candidatus Poribacteria bacterium]MBT7100721.1 M20 family metallopeptidase [Candidatus Poribacteria bacterium]MBT7805612.1 M20 family metallopeptidase [Candidatus Poribacteria bacterium]
MDVSALLRKLDDAIRPERLMATAWDLVNIPSPTGETEAVTACYADMYRKAGLDVHVSNTVPNAPNMAAYLAGNGDGRTLHFDGHADVIGRVDTLPDGSTNVVPIPHPDPRIENDVLYGRGAADMKGGLAIMLEAARCFAEVGFPFSGRLLFTTHGWHEAPLGYAQGVKALIADGHVGDATLVAEGAPDLIAIAGRGMAIYTVSVTRPGDVQHENSTAAATPNPLIAAGRLLGEIEALRQELSLREHDLLRPETIFVGQTHGGDFYNRFPNAAMIMGTRRWHPANTFEGVRDELRTRLEGVAAAEYVEIDIDWQLVRPSYEIPADAPIIAAAQTAFRHVKGVEPEIRGYPSVGDAATFAREGGSDALWFGPNGHGAHSDLESLALDEMVDRTRMFFAATVAYFSGSDAAPR